MAAAPGARGLAVADLADEDRGPEPFEAPLEPRGLEPAECTAFLAAMAWMLADRIPSVIRAHQLTSDLKLPMWPFYVVAVLGAIAAALVGAIRLYRLARGQSIER